MSVGAHQSTAAAPGAPLGVAVANSQLERVGWLALLALAPATLIYLSFNAGGYFPSAQGLVALALAIALVLRTTLAERPFEGFDRPLAIPLVALTLYAAFQLLSTRWSQATANSLDAFSLTLLYVLGMLLYGSLRYTRARLDWLLRAVAGALAAVCLIGLISRTLPHAWPTASSFYDQRLNFPLTYWNAEGMLATIVLILGLHLSADRDTPPAIRVIAAAVLPAIAATLLLTFSRGALGAAAIGLLAYCLLTRFSTLPTALLALAPPVAIATRSAWNATALAGKHPTDALAVSQGHHLAVVVGLCMLGAGALRALLLLADRRIAQLPFVRSPPRRTVRAGIGAGAGVLVLALALALGAGGFLHREYDRFVQGTHEGRVVQTRDRLTDPANDGRLPLWRAALDIYRTEKLHGTGAGTYQQYFPRYRKESGYVVDAHSLYLQSLAELGLVGFALILIVVLGMLSGLLWRIRGRDRPLYAALFAMCLAWAVHQGFDWDWQMPAATLGVLMLAGLALARPRDGKIGLTGLPMGRTLVALGWLVLAVAPVLGSISYARLQDSATELRRGECASAKQQALSSLSISAKRPQAYVVIGLCDLQQGYAQAAVPAMAQAASLEPQSWEEQYWLAVARAAAGLNPHAAIGRAIALNPSEAGLRNARRKLRGEDPRTWERAAPRLGSEALTSGKFAISNI
ncbi:MAG TPA: O-antigen ligase family protein [Solirubrobacteraceae bacterium]|nr:O-antigen ligase family protein [Solirubrobacteraceae bacterium]